MAQELDDVSGIGCSVLVANRENFPDGLTGAVFGLPVLLTEADDLPDETATELQRMADNNECSNGEPAAAVEAALTGQLSQIFVLGGTAAVSASVFQELAGFTTSITRLAGADRYETALVIAEEFLGSPVSNGHVTVFLATGEDFPDALAAGPVAGSVGIPILLNDGDVLRQDVADFMANNSVKSVLILGGAAAVPLTIDQELADLNIAVTRLDGADRFETAVKIAERAIGSDVRCIPRSLIVNGQAFADALAAGPLGASGESPILLVEEDSLPPSTAGWLSSIFPEEVLAIGGTAVISQSVLDAAVAAATPPACEEPVALL